MAGTGYGSLRHGVVMFDMARRCDMTLFVWLSQHGLVVC